MVLLRWLPDFLGLLASLLFVWPVLRINSIAKRIWQLEQLDFHSVSDDFFVEERNELIKRYKGKKGNWNKTDEFFLFGGLIALFLSFFCGILATYFLG